MTTTMTPPGATERADAFPTSLLFLGIALAIFGIIAIAASFVATVASVVLFGGLLIAAGVVEFIHAAKMRGDSRIGLRVISGIVYVIAGLLLLIHPVAAALGLTLVIAAYLFVAGIVRIVYGARHRQERQWGWSVFAGILDIVLAAIIALGWPWTGLWVIGAFVGIEMLFNGISAITLGLGMRQNAPRAEIPAST